MQRVAVLLSLSALVLCLSVFASADAKVRFDGHSLARVFIWTEEQRVAVEALGWDVWTAESNVVLGENHILLPPGGAQVLSALNVDINEIMMEDV